MAYRASRSRQDLQCNEDEKADTRADDGTVHAYPEQVRLYLIVDEVVELLVRQALEDTLDDDADERAMRS